MSVERVLTHLLLCPLQVRVKVAKKDYDFLVEHIDIDHVNYSQDIEGQHKNVTLINVEAELYQQVIEGKTHERQGLFDKPSYRQLRRKLHKLAPLRASLFIDRDSGKILDVHYRLADKEQTDPELVERYQNIHHALNAIKTAAQQKLLKRVEDINSQLQTAEDSGYHLKIGPLEFYSQSSQYAQLDREARQLAELQLNNYQPPKMSDQEIANRIEQLSLAGDLINRWREEGFANQLELLQAIQQEYDTHVQRALDHEDRVLEILKREKQQLWKIRSDCLFEEDSCSELVRSNLSQMSLWKEWADHPRVDSEQPLLKVLDFVWGEYHSRVLSLSQRRHFKHSLIEREQQAILRLIDNKKMPAHKGRLSEESFNAQLAELSLWSIYNDREDFKQLESRQQKIDYLRARYKEHIAKARKKDVHQNLGSLLRERSKELPADQQIPDYMLEKYSKQGFLKPGLLKSLESSSITLYQGERKKDGGAEHAPNRLIFVDSSKNSEDRESAEDREIFERKKQTSIQLALLRQQIIDRCRKKPTNNRCVYQERRYS